MKSAIKVKLKNNTGGLGHDQGAEFTFHWWDHIFNKAASSFKVNESEDGVVMEKCEGKKITPLLISNKRGLATRLGNKSLLYGTFVKAGTYDSNKSQTEDDDVINEFSSDSEDSDDEDGEGDKKGLINDTLQKMFLETGLTGHKAARHGHSLNGKLQRLMRQEERELPKSTEEENNEKSTNNISDVSESNDKDTTKRKKKKKVKDNVITNPDNPTPASDEVDVVKERKKKKKHLDNVAVDPVGVCVESVDLKNTDTTSKSKKEKRKHKLKELGDNAALIEEEPKKKKKKKKMN